MKGLGEDSPKLKVQKSPKSCVYLYGFGEIDVRSPLKFMNQMASPKKSRRSAGKENNHGRPDSSPKTVSLLSRIPRKESLSEKGLKRADSGTFFSKRKSLGPLFDPEMVESCEREQIKNMVSGTPISLDSESILQQFEEVVCPPRGQNGVVLYSTTLSGVQKTFVDCNKARAVIESHQVEFFDRDISMHSGFKKELKSLVGSSGFKMPLVFVKGRLIGGSEELVKLEILC